ncbi:MAG: thioredoxin [Myxococcota bacterium]
MAVVSVSDATFEQEVLGSDLPVLIDLHADWCQPCKQLSPIVEEVARELEGKLKVCKIDVDKSPMVAQTFRVQSIPMLVLFHQRQVVAHQMGVVDKQTILRMVEPVLPSDAAEVKAEELAQLLRMGRAVAVDIRDEASFGRYRIPTAKNIPAERVPERVHELIPSDGRIRVLYGRTGDEAKELAEKLREQGVEVGFLSGGFLHWEADGLEVERG